MAGIHAPKGFGLMFVLVGIPLILWSAWGTNRQLTSLDSTEARQKQCIARAGELSIAGDEAQSFCSCLVSRAKSAGILKRHGGYDEKALKPIVDACAEDYVGR